MLDSMTGQYCDGETDDTKKDQDVEGYANKTCKKALSVFYATCKEKGLDYTKPMPKEKVREHVSAILPFTILEKIVDKPLKILGLAITAGMSRNFNIYTPEELQAFASKLVAAPVYVEHVAVPNAVGKVTKTEWDGSNLFYEAEIYDEDTAAKIRKGLIQHVSVGADYETLDIVDGQVPHGLHNAELSLVAVPGIPETNVQVLEKLKARKRVKEQDERCVFCGEPAEIWVACCFDCFKKLPLSESKKKEILEKFAPAGDSAVGKAPLIERGNMKKKVKAQDGEGSNNGNGEGNLTVDQIKAKIADLSKKNADIMAQLYPEAELTDEQRATLNAESETIWAEINAFEKALAAAIIAQVGATLGEGYQVALEVKLKEAEWTQDFINNLPDSSFAFIEEGGEKDEEGKTKPRSLRHLPFKDAEGNINKAHLNNALGRLAQTDLSDEAKAAAKKKLCAAVKTWNEAHSDDQITSDVCGVEPSNQEQLLEAKVTELLARVDKLEKGQGQGNLSESLLKNSKEPMVPVRRVIETLEGLLLSPVVERSSMGEQLHHQQIRKAIFEYKEMLKSG